MERPIAYPACGFGHEESQKLRPRTLQLCKNVQQIAVPFHERLAMRLVVR